MSGLKGFNQDDVAVAMECEHDVAVARVGADGPPSHVVIINFTDRLDDYVEFFYVLEETSLDCGDTDRVGLDVADVMFGDDAVAVA